MAQHTDLLQQPFYDFVENKNKLLEVDSYKMFQNNN